MPLDLKRVLNEVLPVAKQAGDLVLKHYQSNIEVHRKQGNEPVTIADRESSELIVSFLQSHFPTDGILSEEGEDQLSWHRYSRTWMVDPLDGTADFIAGRPGFSVMIGLLEMQGTTYKPVLGVIHDPLANRSYSAILNQGAYQHAPGQPSKRLAVSTCADLTAFRLISSRSHRSRWMDALKERIGITDEIQLGSVGLKIIRIASNVRDLYVNPEGHCRLWDVCAPEIILHEAGGKMTTIHGDALSYTPDTLRINHGIIASNGCAHDAIIRATAPILSRKKRSP